MAFNEMYLMVYLLLQLHTRTQCCETFQKQAGLERSFKQQVH